jgi:Peptidase propeptide and YPEB domain
MISKLPKSLKVPLSVALAALSLVVIGFSIAPVRAQNARHSARPVQVTQKRAEQIALSEVPGGKIRSSKLTGAGSQRFWAVFVARPGKKNAREIHVDARSGKVLKVQTEKPEDQAEEPVR